MNKSLIYPSNPTLAMEYVDQRCHFRCEADSGNWRDVQRQACENRFLPDAFSRLPLGTFHVHILEVYRVRVSALTLQLVLCCSLLYQYGHGLKNEGRMRVHPGYIICMNG